ncbi:MAG: division/cell wall cluster transcriptional repressor MraZ [Candidatus Hydrogenedens sp.]
MIIYQSEYHVTLDDKNRILVPSSLKSIMSDNNHTVWYLTRGFENNLLLFPSQIWKEITDKLEQLPTLNPKVQILRRRFIGGSVQVRPDGQYRITLPAPFRNWAEIMDNAVIAGCGMYLEIWNEKLWDNFFKNTDIQTDMKIFMEELFPLTNINQNLS